VWGLLRNLVLLAAAGVAVAYAVYDDPSAKAREAYEDLQCRLDRTKCTTVAFLILPGVEVYFVDESLASREGRQIAILGREWPYCYDATGEVYRVARYFETDFASIPDWAQFYINPQEKSVIGAAIVHDWLYAVGGPAPEEAKRKADEIFRFELEQAGVNFLKRNIMYAAVRFGGKSFGSAEEMRFRDPETGRAFRRRPPRDPVIDRLAPGCGDFLDLYWNPEEAFRPAARTLDPRIIQEWIDLS